jgi:chaperonin GroES
MEPYQQGSSQSPLQFSPQQAQLQPPVPEQGETEEQQLQRESIVRQQNINIAEELEEDLLVKIGMDCKKGFDADEDSIKEWKTETLEWMKLAKQTRESKTYPWPNASNVKYPLISTAALQFNARAYPTLVPADGKVVQSRVIGKDPTGQKRLKSDRIATYMSWQCSKQLDYWEEEMDKILISVPIVGTVFKKTYYCPDSERVESKVVFADNFVINYWSRSIEESERYSEVLEKTKQSVKSLQLRGVYLDVDLGDPQSTTLQASDFTTTYKIIEQHTWLDLDDDGLREPYTVIFHYDSGKILRISARYDADAIILTEDGKPAKFEGKCYYTKFGFIPDPDGGFYDLGFGHLLGPINEAVNTLTNQLVDAGTLANLQAGFIGKGLRVKMGDTPLKPGEWRVVNAVGDDIRKQLVPLPAKDPSNVLFQLLGSLITSGKELASVAEIFVGKMPGQNTPATTTMATIEQGMKVFTAIYKRIYRSLEKEFKKIFELNNLYLDTKTYIAVLDEPVNPSDFDYKTYDVCPSADPTATTQSEKLAKAQALMELLNTGLLDPIKVIMRVLEAQDQPNWQELIPGLAETGSPQPPQEKPDPKLQAMQAKAQTDQVKAQQQMQIAAQKAEMDRVSKETDIAMKAQMQQLEAQHKERMMSLEAESKARLNQIFMAEAQQKAILSAVQGNQKLQQNEMSFKQKLLQERSTSKQKSTNSNSGKATPSRSQSRKK